MKQIHTCVGPKTPAEALEILKYSKLPTGSLFGIYAQLLENDQDTATEASAFVCANPERFNEKTRRAAKEFIEKKPVGVKKITSEASAREFLRNAGPQPTLIVTFRHDQPTKVVAFTMNAHLFRFHEPGAASVLQYVVASSGRWEKMPRTYTVTVLAVSDGDLFQVAKCFAYTVESVELKSSLLDQVEARNKGSVSSLLLEKPDLFYDQNVFRAACDDLNGSSQADAWIKKIGDPNANMRVVIISLPEPMRLDFLKKYIERFEAVMSDA